ncbi:MAG: hypothetical protein D4R57_01540 [Verrucomicrobiales bacterium]|nr:MAG: hypothetical protein D4R57_01540 [Verrucomicrobiales bacterium]
MKPPYLLLALIALLSFVGCTAHRNAAISPQYAAVTRKAGDITKTINLIETDGKEVKRLQSQSLSLLDRLDFKTTILLK